MIGGPYEERSELAEALIAAPGSLGSRLAGLRAVDEPDDEVRAMIAAVESWFARQSARIDLDMMSVVEQAEGWDVLAKSLAGDTLGERAAKERDALRSTPTFAAEEDAEQALRHARKRMRRCPPRGGYFPYHFTRINYTVIDDPAWVATRMRMITEFRIELRRIVEAFPDTYAAGEASDLLTVHDAPELTALAARERVERAERLLKAEGRPTELYEAWLLLLEVRDGYAEADEISARVGELLSTHLADRQKDLVSAESLARALREESELLKAEAARGGSLMSREKADEIGARLNDVAKRSGKDTVLAAQIAAYVSDLARSFDGTPLIGVRLDPQFPGPGARIARVDVGTGASKAGLAPGDVILTIGGTALANINDFTKALAAHKPGEKVEVDDRRATGEVETLELPLGRRLRIR